MLKEKIKSLKERLKIWNRKHFRDTLKKVKKNEADLNKMEEETIHRQFSPQEVLTKKQLQEALWVAAQSHESFLR